MSYRLIEEPLMYVVYVLVVSLISVTIIVFGSNMSTAMVDMVMGVIANNFANEINILGTYPKGNTVCIPVSFPGMIKVPEMGVIESYNQRMLYIKIKIFNMEKTYYEPLVPIIGVKVYKLNGTSVAYTPFFISKDDVDSNVQFDDKVSTWFSDPDGKYKYRYVQIINNGIQTDDYYAIQYIIPFDQEQIQNEHMVCFVTYGGVIVPTNLM